MENVRQANRDVVAEYDEITLVETRGWGIETTDGVHISKSRAGSFSAGKKLADAIRQALGNDFFAVD